MNQNEEHLGTRLAGLRDKLGKTQEDIAKELSISREKYNSWEQNIRQMKSVEIERLCRYFKVSADYLLFGVESEQTDIYHAVGLSREAIDTLKRFNDSDFFPEHPGYKKGLCNALNKALSSRGLLYALANLMVVKGEERGYFESITQSKDGKFYETTLSPDSLTLLLFARLQLIIQGLRMNDATYAAPYPPTKGTAYELFDAWDNEIYF